ncbi:Hypothetical protein R9X50_00436300 [Acrodontium crateriforme]|uniref:Uncharacterized protein n=1 Tax=Acrodontium crateriforme TaxID=150365 RepID=A0AAQ3MAW2_9PEZI|nr:Hypothetical protein R9X50_00436300 [Acrodontium crateriforme]
MVVPRQPSVTTVVGVGGMTFPTEILIYKSGKDLNRTIFQLRVDEANPKQTVVWNPNSIPLAKSSLSLIDNVTLSAIEKAPIGTAHTAPFGAFTQSSTITFSASNVQLKLISHRQFSAQVFAFEMWVDRRMPLHSIKEKFEWRRTSGLEVNHAAHSPDAEGWKLVRLRSKFDYTTFKGGPHDENLTSDGYEVVAVWANYHDPGTENLVSVFKFLGSGAGGDMGGLWSTMAVLTGLRIAQLEHETRARQRVKREVYKHLRKLKPVKTFVDAQKQSLEMMAIGVLQKAYNRYHKRN